MAHDIRRVVLAMLWSACAACGSAQQPRRAHSTVLDRRLGLSNTSVAEAPILDVYAYGGKSPGESTRLARAYAGAPPLIPHSLDGLLPITRDGNACLVCHGTPGSASEDLPPAPPSHFVDMRSAPDVHRKEVAGARWVCTSCHIPQTNAPTLVVNGAR